MFASCLFFTRGSTDTVLVSNISSLSFFRDLRSQCSLESTHNIKDTGMQKGMFPTNETVLIQDHLLKIKI
jgi:hypothetical protein